MCHTTLDADDLMEAVNQEESLTQPITANAYLAVISGGSRQGAVEHCFAATQTSHRGPRSWNGEFNHIHVDDLVTDLVGTETVRNRKFARRFHHEASDAPSGF